MSPTQTFDACVAAHRRLDTASISIDASTRAPGKQFRNRYSVEYRRPGTMLMRVRAVKTASQPASDRTYFVDGSKLVAVDHTADEYLTRTATDAGGTLAARAIRLLDSLDDSVHFVLDPDALKSFFANFRTLSGWRSSSGGAATVLTRVVPGKSSVRFDFGKNALLKAVRISTPQSLLSWRFEYGRRPSALALTIPKGSRKVHSFLAASGPRTQFSSQAASRIWDSAIKAYGRLVSASFVVRSGGRPVKVLFSGHRASQRQDGLAWSYDGHTLSVSRSGRFYRGPASAREIPGVVGESIEPFLHAWALHKNPARVLAADPMSARLAGMVLVGSVPCDLIEFKRQGFKVSVLVRRTDHLFARIASEGRDPSGTGLSSLDREIRYLSVNRPLPMSDFEIKPKRGQKVQKLP